MGTTRNAAADAQRAAPPRLLAISDGLTPSGLNWLDELVKDGVDTLQIREKHLGDRALLHLVERAIARVHERFPGRLTVLVNGRADIAVVAGAHGVHLPSRGVPTEAFRARFPGLLLGRSCHSEEEIQNEALRETDYVTFSPIRSTPSKVRYGPPRGFEALRFAVVAGKGLPIVALGGLGPDDVRATLETGAAGMAGIRVFQDADSRRRLATTWKDARS